MKSKNIFFKFIILLCLFKSTLGFAQVNPLGIDNSFIGLDRENGFFIMSAVTLGSYFLIKHTSDNDRLDFYQAHAGYYNGDGYNVFMQNFGVEREYSPWFSMRAEGNIQEFIKNTPGGSTFGVGFKIYSHWSLFGQKKLSPFFEYGAGPFFALNKFPSNGSRFSFNLTYAVGLEYTLGNKNKIRFDVNFIHHSNAGLANRNPGFDSNGISVSYSWFLE